MVDFELSRGATFLAPMAVAAEDFEPKTFPAYPVDWRSFHRLPLATEKLTLLGVLAALLSAPAAKTRALETSSLAQLLGPRLVNRALPLSSFSTWETDKLYWMSARE